MHHFIYPLKDTFITNQPGLDAKNFGITEILQIGTNNTATRILSPTTDYTYTNATFTNQGVEFFTGTFSGSFAGSVSNISGSISGSNLIFTSSYFSGSVDGVGFVGSGSYSGSNVIGYVTGSLVTSGSFGIFSGYLNGADVCLTGTGSGTDTRNQQRWETTATTIVNRSLLQFDITAISQSIVNGEINPQSFSLVVKVCNEYQLPIQYTIYALPVSQSWTMGNGYLSDGGSDSGASWDYRDDNGGTLWFNTLTSSVRPPIDFISNPGLATASFAYGGGTFYTSSVCSQSFNFQSSDINMDITPMVMAWLSGSIPNEGLMLISSDELNSTGSGFVLNFFSQNTNTIYSPYLDVAWDDVDSVGFITGSIFTASVTFATASSGITASIQSGSNLSGLGVSGSFSASAFITQYTNYITASNQPFNSSTTVNPFNSNAWHCNQTVCNWGNRFIQDDIYNYYVENAQLIENQFALDYYDDYENFGYGFIGWGGAWGNTYWNPDTQTWSSGKWIYPFHHHRSGSCPPHNYPVREFTGSFTGSFAGTASYVNGTLSGSLGYDFEVDYFSGSIDGNIIETTYSEITGTLVNAIVSGSITSSAPCGLFTGIMTSSLILLYGTGSGIYRDSTYNAFYGFVTGVGYAGNITGDPVFGYSTGLIAISQSVVCRPCGTSFSASLVTASFLGGPFVGDVYSAYYVDFALEEAHMTGSWSQTALLGEQVFIQLPSPIDPYAYAIVTGSYINGTALGLYTLSASISSSFVTYTSASFNGQFISGNVIGGYISMQLSGSIITSSYVYTSSVELSSSVFTALDTTKPFTVTLTNLQPEYKAGDIAKLGVFARKQYPLKQFGKTTQQVQYIIPEYLPTSSYFALKDDVTGEIVLDFDQYTAIGCDYPIGNYFFVDTTALPQERYYRVLIRVTNSDSSTTVDTGKTFKVIR